MPLSQAQIANMALSHIGQNAQIASLDDDDPAAAVCKLFYTSALERLLGDFDWRFARARAVLVEITNDDPPPAWDYRYALPADCVAAREIEDNLRVRAAADRIPFDKSYSSVNGPTLVTDLADAVLWYTANVANTVYFPPRFAYALSWYLAADIAMPLSKDARLAESMRQRAIVEGRIAATHDAIQGQDDPPPPTSYENARL
jgi:hypothetical protein